MKRWIVLAGIALVGVSTAHVAERISDEQEVKAAVLDYVEGIYSTDPARVDRSVASDLVKRGYYKDKKESPYQYLPMTREELLDIASKFNRNKTLPANAPREVKVFDVSDQTASAKVTAVWGIDYLHLAKVDGKWKIVNVLWQSPPPKAAG